MCICYCQVSVKLFVDPNMNVHCVSKDVISLSCYNIDVHEPILIIVGKTVAEKVGNQRMLYFPPHLTSSFVLLLLLLLLLLLHLFNSLFSRTTWVSRLQKGKPFCILLEQEMMGWQWHQLDHMQIICTLLQTDNHASTSPVFTLPAAQPTA